MEEIGDGEEELLRDAVYLLVVEDLVLDSDERGYLLHADVVDEQL